MTNLGGGSVPCHAMQLLDRDGDEEVSYDEFCRYCVMLPASQASTKYISATAWLAANPGKTTVTLKTTKYVW